MRILLISHQLDYSGAPLALLELARVLRQLGHDVALASLSPGPLADEFSAHEVRPLRSREEQFDLYVANTVLTVPAALSLARSPDRVLAWIHETKYFFRILRADPGDFSLSELRFAAFPARFQIEEFAEWMPAAVRVQLRNCVRMPVIVPSATSEHYYVCPGRWEARKNQARLLELTRALPVEPTIWFVGAERPPGVPPSIHRFPGTVSPAESKRIIALSMGLVSPSLAEAQPLTVIEATMAGRPVLLSDIPAHRELQEAMTDVVLFDASRAESFAAGFRRLEELAADAAVTGRLQAEALRHFGPTSFADSVRTILDCLTSERSLGR